MQSVEERDADDRRLDARVVRERGEGEGFHLHVHDALSFDIGEELALLRLAVVAEGAVQPALPWNAPLEVSCHSGRSERGGGRAEGGRVSA